MFELSHDITSPDVGPEERELKLQMHAYKNPAQGPDSLRPARPTDSLTEPKWSVEEYEIFRKFREYIHKSVRENRSIQELRKSNKDLKKIPLETLLHLIRENLVGKGDGHFDIKFLQFDDRWEEKIKLINLVKNALQEFEGKAKTTKQLTGYINARYKLSLNQRKVRDILKYDLGYTYRRPNLVQRHLF